MDIAVFDDPKLSTLDPDEEISEENKLFDCVKSDPNSTVELTNEGREDNDKTVLICSAKGFHNERSLLNHERTHTGDKPSCDPSLSQEAQLKLHETTQDTTHQSITSLSDTQLISKDTDPSPFKLIAAFTCGINPTSAVADAYEFSDTDENFEELTDTYKKTDKKPEEVTDTDKKTDKACMMNNSKLNDSAQRTQLTKQTFSCTNCPKDFSTSAALVVHERTHTREKPFACDLCNYSCKQKWNLNHHKRMHAVNKTCKYCGKSFANPGSLTLHERSHTGEKPSPSNTVRTQKEKSFRCSQCDLSFTKRRNLTIHERTHTGEKPFSCSICGLGFSQRANLYRHEKTHTGEKRFKCAICEKSFTERESLTYHELIHTGEKPFAFSLCGKQLRTEAGLRCHELRAHKLKETTVCSYCKIPFPSSFDLKVHERTCTGEKPFSYSFGGVNFSIQDKLRDHNLFECGFCSCKFSEEAKLRLHEKFHMYT